MTGTSPHPNQIARAEVVQAIKAVAEPLFYDSGYRKALDPSKGILGGTRPLRLWAPKQPIALDGFALTEVLAITEDGIIEDAHGGGAVTGEWDCYPLEDLTALLPALREAASKAPDKGVGDV